MSSEMKMRPADDLEINLCHDDVMRQQQQQTTGATGTADKPTTAVYCMCQWVYHLK